MNCRRADELIQRSLDGTLTARERGELDAHLDGCAACRSASEAYRHLTHRATDWTRRPAEEVQKSGPDAFTAQVLARIAADAEASGAAASSSSLRERALPWLRPLAVGVAFAVVLGLLSGLFGPQAFPSLPSPPSADLLLPRPQTALEVPGWLLANLRALPGDALRAWTDVQVTFPRIAGLREALVIALLANGLFFFHATRRSAGRSLAR